MILYFMYICLYNHIFNAEMSPDILISFRLLAEIKAGNFQGRFCNT